MSDAEKSQFKSAQKVQAKDNEKEVKLDDFELMLVLGRGAFGKVYLAKFTDDQGEEIHYAIKQIRKDILLEEDKVENVAMEKKILLEMDHPFLASMDYLFQDDHRLYFVMPFIKGAELYKYYKKKQRFPEEEVRFYAAQIIIALGYLHEKNIAHRDLKLENILLDSDGYIKLIDFGLASKFE